ncbi:MAG: SMC-Scp complex subunit ScpB [Gemmataceae bacterium]|nr:SMC-Scp complex subunit ScpB [Gemmataceae bacterium]
MPDEPTASEDLGRAYAEMLGGPGEPSVDEQADALPAEPGPAAAPQAPPAPLRILEALLFVGGTPLTPARACQVIRGLSVEQFTELIDELNRAYRRQDRPYSIQSRDQGYVLALKPKFRPVMAKVFGGVREARLSTQAIDVLALVAYRQPATKVEIDSLRGAESATLLRQLVRRGLIQVMYRAEAERKEVSYGTTPRFLEMFGLQSLDDLPKTQDFA